MRLIDIDGMPNFEVKTTDGKEYILLPFKHLYDIPTVQAIPLDRIKRAREDIENIGLGSYLEVIKEIECNDREVRLSKKFATAILDKLIESEEMNG